MLATRRQPGDRRWFPAEFPLTDCEGFLVPVDRRRLPNRRRMKTINDAGPTVTRSENDTD